MYNKKAIQDALAKLNSAKKPKQEPDIIVDPKGQWAHPGVPTRIPSNNITMQGVPYPVLGVDDLGNEQIMLPGADYTFPGANYVDEFPMAKYGGLTTGLTNTKGNLLMNKKGKRIMAQSGSLSATNELFLGSPLVTKRKRAVYVPGADFQKGGPSIKATGFQGSLDYDSDNFIPGIQAGYQKAIGFGRNNPNKLMLKPYLGYSNGLEAGVSGDYRIKGESMPDPTTQGASIRGEYAYNPNKGSSFDFRMGPTFDYKLQDGYTGFNPYGYVGYNGNDGINYIERNDLHGINYGAGVSGYIDKEFRNKSKLGVFGEFNLDLARGKFDEIVGDAETENLAITPHGRVGVRYTMPTDTKRSQFKTRKPKETSRTRIQEGGSIELDLTPDEIKQYRKGGFIVEELPKAQEGIRRAKNFTSKPLDYYSDPFYQEPSDRLGNNQPLDIPSEQEIQQTINYNQVLGEQVKAVKKAKPRIDHKQAVEEAQMLLEVQSQPQAEIRALDPKGKDKDLVYLDTAGDAKTIGDYVNIAWGAITNPIDAATAAMTPGGFANNFYINQNPAEKMMRKGYIDYDRVQNNAMMNATSSLGYMLPFVGPVAQGKDLYQAGMAFYENPSWHKVLNIGLAASPGAFKRVPNSIPVGLNQVRPVVKNTIKELDKFAGKVYGKYAERSLKMPEINYDDISKNVNQLISKGDLGIIKPRVRNKYDFVVQPVDSAKDVLRVGFIDKNANRYVPTGYLELPFSHSYSKTQPLSQIIKTHGRDIANVKKVGKDLFSYPRSGFTEYGLRKAGDFPFKALTSNSDALNLLNELKGSGVSAEINQALNKVLKEKGLQLYSGATGHTSDGASRYLRELLVGRVSPTNNPHLTYLMELYKHHKKTGNKRAELNVLRQIEPEIYNSNFKFHQQGGIVVDLTPDEIKKYQEAGYVVEEYQDGGDVKSSHGWDYKKEGDKYFTKKVGTDKWIEPTGEALKAIQQKVFGDIEYTESDRKSDYINNVQKLISSGYTLDDLVKQRVGTKQGLLELFPQLADGSTTPIEESPVTPKKDVNVVKEKPILDTRPSMLNLGLADYNRPKMFNTNIDEIKARAKADAIANVEKENAISKRPTEMPYIPSWQDYAARINQGLSLPEYTEAEVTDEEIKELEKQGYVVEEVKPSWLDNLQNNVSQTSVYNRNTNTLDPLGRPLKQQPTQEELQNQLSWIQDTKGLVQWKPEGIRIRKFGETEFGMAAKELTSELEKMYGWAQRYAVKKGIKDPMDLDTEITETIDFEENTSLTDELDLKSDTSYVPKPEGLKIFGKTSHKHLKYQNEFDLDKGQRYLPIANVGNSNNKTKYENVEGIAHFLLDTDLTTGFQHPYAINNVKQQLSDPKPVMSPGSTVEIAYVPVYTNNSDGTVTLTYKPQPEAAQKVSSKPVAGPGNITVRPQQEDYAHNVKSILRQYRFTDLDWEGKGTPGGVNNSFANSVSGLNTKDGTPTNLIFPKSSNGKKAYGKFGGASVVFILPNKNIAVDFAGSIEDIKAKAEELSKKYNIELNDLIVGFHDIGSFSAKPAANDKGELYFNQWADFNNEPYTGGGLAIIKE
jgi:hypothetical protein